MKSVHRQITRQQLLLTFCLGLCIMLLSMERVESQDASHPYADVSYFSKVFGHNKTFRLYLPSDYETSGARYPVIYFFHGWGGRYFKDDNALLEYDRIGKLVDQYQIILVMWDGNMEESEPRPYNIGNHKDIRYPVQMKDYFLELVAHIDSSYRTLSDRNHRGIIGFSMGGIMSFFLAGKFPDRICAAVNLAGSPEFFIGYPDNHTLYPLRYTFGNLKDVSLRQHGGDSDILVYLNEEVRKGAEWEGNDYRFWGFHGGHMIDKPGETKAFEMAIGFITDAFRMEKGMPQQWSHYDIYSTFEVWDYQVESNKNVPGFLYLRNVGKHGFGLQSLQWLPDGPEIEGIQAAITTAPIYIPDKDYEVVALSSDNADSVTRYKAMSDARGRITIQHSCGNREYGIYSDNDKPDFVAAGYEVEDHNRFLPVGSHNLVVKLFNRGGEVTSPLKIGVSLQTRDSSVTIPESKIAVEVQPGQRIVVLPPFTIDCIKTPPDHGEPFQVKFTLKADAGFGINADVITVPVLFDAPLFTRVIIDDGRVVRDKAYGTGNGNGVAEAGENVLLYTGDHRLRLYTDDPWVIIREENLVDEQIPSVWEDSFTLSSVISISKECPDGHVIEFTGNYETLTYNPVERKVHWGKVRLVVHRADKVGRN
jgi:enterochelin esterase-like enzyme